jgi:hypothetical protein
MGVIETDWFEPARLFDTGYPEGLTSALRVLPNVLATVRAELATLSPRRILEIGPGDAPIAQAGEIVYLDVVPFFLEKLAGPRVRGDLFAAPFAPGAFDVVIAADVLTHIRPADRRLAVARIAELGRAVLLFNPEPGTGQVPDSRSPTHPVAEQLATGGWDVTQRKFVAVTAAGEYVMRLVKATRPSGAAASPG